MKATKPRSHEATEGKRGATKRRSDEAEEGKRGATKPRSHEATEPRSHGGEVDQNRDRKRAGGQSHEATEGKGTEARWHEGTEGSGDEGLKGSRVEGNKDEARWHKENASDEAEEGKRAIPRAIIVIVAVMGLLTSACVRRTISITTEPPNARVFLNDQEVGRSAVTTDFLWYGDYGVTIRKEGYETLQTNWVIKPPWYQYIPLDFFTEVLWPGQLHDTHSRHFVLEPAKIPTQEELIGRAGETRDRALDARK